MSGDEADLRQEHQDLRREIHQLDGAVEELELRGEVAALAEFLPRFARRYAEHFLREEALVQAGGDSQARLVSLKDDRNRVQAQVEHLTLLVGRVLAGHEAARDELWLEAQKVKSALSCRLCHEEQKDVCTFVLRKHPCGGERHASLEEGRRLLK